MIRRRDFTAPLGGAAAAWPFVARTQQPAMPVVGFVSSRSLDGSTRHAAAYVKGLGETGYVEGRNVLVEYHWLEGQYDRLPSLMADLVRRRVPGDRYLGRPSYAGHTTFTITGGQEIIISKSPSDILTSNVASANLLAVSEKSW